MEVTFTSELASVATMKVRTTWLATTCYIYNKGAFANYENSHGVGKMSTKVSLGGGKST